jgi:hypothetical protein
MYRGAVPVMLRAFPVRNMLLVAQPFPYLAHQNRSRNTHHECPFSHYLGQRLLLHGLRSGHAGPEQSRARPLKKKTGQTGRQ